MRLWAYILLVLGTTLMAETPTPTPSPVPNAVDRLFDSVRTNLNNFIGGASDAATPTPAAELAPVAAENAPAASPAPKAPDAISSILSLKPEKPAAVSLPAASSSMSPAGGTGAPPKQVVYDDTQQKKGEVGNYGNGNDSGGGGKHSGIPTKGGDRGKPQAFDKWYPVCLFFEGANAAANAITKGLTDMAAKCGVNLITYPVFINGGGNVNAVKQQAKSKCNATDGFGRFGVNRGSAILVTNNQNLPVQMCNAQGAAPGEIQHCGEMGWDVGQSLETRLMSTARWGGAAAGMAFGVAVGSSLASVAAVFGQTQLGLPPGYGAGNGVGEDNEGYASAGSRSEPGWSGYGCQRMRETAFDNDGRWKYLADRKFYAVPPKNGKLYDLAGGKPLFNKPKPAPPGGAAAGGGGAGGGGGGAGTPAASSASAGSSASSSFSSAPPPGTGEATSSVAGGHKQANKATSSGAVQSDTSGGGGAVADRRELEDGSTVRNRLLVTDGPAGGQSEAASAEGSRPRAEAEGGGRNTASVYYDDGAKNPTSVGATSYDTGGGRIQGGGQLLSAGGAAAVKSQIDGELPADGEGKPGEEKDDDSKSKKRPTDASAKEASAERKPASSAFDLVFSGDFFKKVFKQRDDSSGDGGDRRPRVVQ